MVVLKVMLLAVVVAVQGAGEDGFATNSIYPEVVSDQPNQLLQISFGGGAPLTSGATVFPKSASNQPSLICPGAQNGQLYTVVMVDPDAPSRARPSAAQWLHWILADIKGEDLSSTGGNVLPGKLITAYNGPTPPKDSGPHRYVLVAYKQAGETTAQQGDISTRAKFQLNNFARQNRLTTLECGAFFFAEN